MRSGQRKCGVIVVERRIRPDHRVMAHRACCRESGRRVRGIIGRSVILLVARVALRAIQRVVVADVANVIVFGVNPEIPPPLEPTLKFRHVVPSQILNLLEVLLKNIPPVLPYKFCSDVRLFFMAVVSCVPFL